MFWAGVEVGARKARSERMALRRRRRIGIGAFDLVRRRMVVLRLRCELKGGAEAPHSIWTAAANTSNIY